jgi:hypothetical protein
MKHTLLRTLASKFGTFLLMLIFVVRGSGQSQISQCYPDVPDIVDYDAQLLAQEIVAKKDAGAMGAYLPTLMFYTLADATVGLKPLGPGHSQEDYQNLGETARTDKQLGTSSKSAGSTTLAESPGFAQLLGFAVEHGAIQQAVSGTTLTLSSSPYALVALANQRDTAELYEEAGFLNRFGGSASFNISDQNNVLASATRGQLTEWSGRFRITGDRSSRSKGFQDFWKTNIAPFIASQLKAVSVTADVIANDPYYGSVMIAFQTTGGPNSLIDPISTVLSNASYTDDEKSATIKNLVLCSLRQFVYEPARTGTAPVGAEVKKKIQTEILPELVKSQQALAGAAVAFKKFVKQFNGRPELTFEYTNHRPATGSVYHELKILFQARLSPLQIVANAGASLYNNPNPSLNQQTVRDYDAAVSFQGGFKNPFASSKDLGKITLSLSSSYERFLENENIAGLTPNIANVQGKLQIPISVGISIPISYTYSSGTEQMNKPMSRFNVGLDLDVDKLKALASGSQSK